MRLIPFYFRPGTLWCLTPCPHYPGRFVGSGQCKECPFNLYTVHRLPGTSVMRLDYHSWPIEPPPPGNHVLCSHL